MKLMSMACVLVWMVAGAFAQQPAAPRPPEPPAAARFDPEAPLAAFELENVALEELVKFLQDSRPGFQAVVVRDPGAPKEYPQISLRLKNVSTAQLFDLLQKAYPGVSIDDTSEGPGGLVYCIKVEAPQPPEGGKAALLREVRVYSLTRAVAALAADKQVDPKDRAKATRDAMSSLLSLFKAAIAQADATGAEPVLQVHEETQTLVFKGTPSQQSLIESVLSSVAVVDRERQKLADREREIQDVKEQMMMRLRRTEEELDIARKMLAEQRAMAMEKALEAERLKLRIEMMQVTAQEIEKLRAAEKAKNP